MNIFKKFRIVAPILSSFLLVGCAGQVSSTNNIINIVDFSEQESTDGQVGSYFQYSKYLSIIDSDDHTYIGTIDKIISPSNKLVDPYNDKVFLNEVGVYRMYISYRLTSKDTRFKIVYINAKDNEAPEAFFRSASRGYLGVEYTLPTPIQNDNSGLPVSITYELFLMNNDGDGKELIPTKNGKFTPTKVGTYSYEATISDCYGNSSKATVTFEITTKTPILHEEATSSNYTSVFRISHTGGGASSSAYFDNEKHCFSAKIVSQDNLYINVDKNIPLETYDLIRIKTRCNSDFLSTFVQGEINGVGKGNSYAYYDRVEEDGFTYFEMSVTKFLPYWKLVSFNHATMILITSKETDFELYEVQLIKKAAISYNSALTTNVNEEYVINTSCDGAIGAEYVYSVKDPLNRTVEVANNRFTPTMIGRYKVTTTLSHFFYQGSLTESIDVISDKTIDIADYETPQIGDEFVIPQASIEGDTTGFDISVTRNGIEYPFSDDKINIKHNGKYSITYIKEYEGVTYQKRLNVGVGITYLESFSDKSSIINAYGSPGNHVSTYYKDSFAGEQGVVAFGYEHTRWPNMQFACPDLSKYDFNDYASISFTMYIPGSILNLNARYGEGNESQDLTYYAEKQGIKADEWSSYSYSAESFFNQARFNSQLPLHLIGVERSENTDTISSTIYISDIYMTKREADVINGFDSISSVSTANVNKTSFLDNFEGEHSVVKFETTKTYPQLFFQYGDVNHYDISKYDFINFRMWIDDCYTGLFMRKGANNAVDVATYHKNVRGFGFDNFSTGHWANFYYPIDAFINSDRQGNKLMLISLRDEALTTSNCIYISEISLVKQEDAVVSDFASTYYCKSNSDLSVQSYDSFNGENSVIKYDMSGSFPNVMFYFKNIANAIELGYTKFVIRAYLTEDIRGLVLRYGANNATDDGTYNRWTIGQITLDQWIDIEYPIDRLINNDRGNLPILLIFQKETSVSTPAYFSSVYLKK